MEEQKLIKDCVKGKPKAQAYLVQKYAPMFKAIARRYVPDQQAADDVVQEAFINIFRYIDNFSGKGSFEGWLRRIVVNASFSYRKKHIEVSYPIDIVTDLNVPSQVPSIYAKLDKEYLMEIIKELPEKYYLSFTLYVIEGYDHKEIAEIMGIQESTSRSNLSRARSKLVELLKKTSITTDGSPSAKAI